MVKVLSVASVLALAGAASAAPFQFLSYEVGGGIPGVVGAGFTPSAGSTFFQAGGGANLASALPVTFFGFVPNLEFDTYLSISATGPAVGGPSTTSRTFYGDLAAGDDTNVVGTLTDAPGGIFSTTAMFTGVGISPQPFMSGFAPNVGGGRGSDNGVFIGRFTVTNGGDVEGGGLFAIQEGGLQLGTLSVGGPAVAIGLQSYVLESFLVGNVAEGAVHDVWLHTFVIPTPGALALLGIGGLVTIRRRRA